MPISTDIDAAFGEAADQRRFEHAASGCGRRGRPRCACAPSSLRKRGIAAAERIGVGFGQRVADDPANVIFAQDGGVELVGHGAATHIAKQASVSLNLFRRERTFA